MQHHHTPLFALRIFSQTKFTQYCRSRLRKSVTVPEKGMGEQKGAGTPWYRSHASATAEQKNNPDGKNIMIYFSLFL